MNACFVDTSAVYAAMDASDDLHRKARLVFERLISEDVTMVSSNYVTVELLALLQKRLGVGAARDFQESVVPLLRLEWVDERTHDQAASALLLASRKGLSIVDSTSFIIMRRLAIGRAFAFDRHFAEQGYVLEK